LKRSVANEFITEVEEARGSTARSACNSKTKLVEAQLEMVCAAGLFHCGAALSRVRWINTRDRLQRDEIDRCVYKKALARAKAHPAVIEALGLPINRRISHLGKHKRERRVW
jgi:hypothetical protein